MTMKLTGIALAIVLSPSLALAKHPRSMQVIEPPKSYVMNEPFVAQEKAATFMLKPGKYLATFEDKDAVYLLGDPDCLEMYVVPPKQPEHAYTQPFNCGIMIPKIATKPATFFAIAGKQPRFEEMGAVINYLIQRDEGRFNFPINSKYVVGLRDKVVELQP